MCVQWVYGVLGGVDGGGSWGPRSSLGVTSAGVVVWGGDGGCGNETGSVSGGGKGPSGRAGRGSGEVVGVEAGECSGVLGWEE